MDKDTQACREVIMAFAKRHVVDDENFEDFMPFPIGCGKRNKKQR
jgi:hypothetical protein